MVFSGYMPSSGIAGLYGTSIFNETHILKLCSQQWNSKLVDYKAHVGVWVSRGAR